ncbi:response regulator [Streptomyces chromofuscus]|uniref:Response regulator transcription factor n=1 Tax=Streptomyces chromofuscus TaxID=42881 RepID=A0A7M2TAI7_STRCW|nr:response regulator transcription factor [Streptomyces chromofuscus]QOV44738.1 response regulator transcription factor [Streptomyces chromofuscus]GGT00683.1 DNA-binding response regulator [Streptomyces chromofuscus]
MAIRVLLVDDQPMIRTGFRLILEAEPDITVVGEAGDGRAGVDDTRTLQPDVVLMDIRMPHMDGVEATRRIVESGSSSRVIILTTFDLDEHVHDALRAGASGFLVKDGPADSLVSAIRTVAEGDAVISPRVTRRLLDRFARLADQTVAPVPRSLDALTSRELDVLRALTRGLSNAEIARELHVSEATVKTHVAHILDKYQLRDRVQAVILAYDTGLVRPAVGG